MPYIHAQGAHKAVDFLTYLQKGNCAQEPNQDTSRDLLPSDRCNLVFNIGFRNGKGRECTDKDQDKYDDANARQVGELFQDVHLRL